MKNTQYPVGAMLRLGGWVILLVAAITAVFGGMEFARERQRLEDDLLLTTQAMSHSVARELSRVQQLSEAISATLEADLLSRNFAAAHAKIQHALASSDIVDHVVVTDESGQQLLNTLVAYGQPLPVTQNMDRIKATFGSGRPYISRLVTGTVSRHHEIFFDVPVMQNGKVAYVITSVLNSDNLRDILVAQDFPDEWVANIFDGDGVVVARTRNPETYVGKKVSERMLDQLARRNSGVFENVNLDGETTIAVFVRSEVAGFGVAVGVPKRLLIGNVIASLPATMIAILVGVLALFAVWHFASNLKLVRKSEIQLRQLIESAEALRESEARYRSLSENSLNGLVRCRVRFERDRAVDLEYLETNPAFAETTGIHEPVVGRCISEVIPGYCENNPDSLQKFGEVARSGKAARWEHHLAQIDRYFSLVIYPMGGDEIVIVSENITERKRQNEELEEYRQHLELLVQQRTQQLSEAKMAAESASVTKSAFLANMSHEIRTPLNAITGMAHLIRRAGLPPAQDERLDKLEAAGEHLLETINAILDLSKIEADKLVLEETSVRPESLVDNVVSILQTQASAKHLRLVSEIQPLPFPLLGDPTRLRQALLNLASNAVKFTETGHVTLRVMSMEARADDVLVCFEVEDTGIGIAPAVMPKLFGAFEQADSSTTRKFGGTGLGLALTKRLALRMGGDAGARSALGRGSTFWFTARLKKGRPSVASVAQDEDALAILKRDHGGCRILLVEDDPVNREIGESILGEIGAVIEVAEDGVEAVARVRDRSFDLILMDMQMPRLDGVEATRQIRLLPRGAHVPILAMTANAFSDDKARCLDAGMDDVVVKPVDPEWLFKTLLTWLDKKRS